MMRGVLQAAAALLASACAASCVAGPNAGATWVHPRTMSDNDVGLAVAECQREASTTHVPYTPTPVYVTGGAYGMIGAAIGAGLARGFAEGQARRDALESCLQRREFTAVHLSEEQEAQVASLPEGSAERTELLQTIAEAQRQAIDDEKAAALSAAAEDTQTVAAASPEAPVETAAQTAAEDAPTIVTDMSAEGEQTAPQNEPLADEASEPELAETAPENAAAPAPQETPPASP